MNPTELPERYKYYFIVLSNKWEHLINGETKKNILMSKSQFIELEDGNCVNKSYIVQFKFDSITTTDKFRLLPQAEIDLIVKEIVKKE